MHSSLRRLALLAAVSLVAVLAVGPAVASANGGGGRGGSGGRDGYGGGTSASALVTQAAKELGVTRAKLKQAIVDAAVARIDEAVDDGDVDSDDADDLKAEAQDNLRFAMSVSRTKTVASNLGISTSALNDGFRAARKTLALARIDRAVASGDVTPDQASELKSELDDADLPGYKASGFGGFALGDLAGGHAGK